MRHSYASCERYRDGQAVVRHVLRGVHRYHRSAGPPCHECPLKIYPYEMQCIVSWRQPVFSFRFPSSCRISHMHLARLKMRHVLHNWWNERCCVMNGRDRRHHRARALCTSSTRRSERHGSVRMHGASLIALEIEPAGSGTATGDRGTVGRGAWAGTACGGRRQGRSRRPSPDAAPAGGRGVFVGLETFKLTWDWISVSSAERSHHIFEVSLKTREQGRLGVQRRWRQPELPDREGEVLLANGIQAGCSRTERPCRGGV
jgi:hypothetical protein